MIDCGSAPPSFPPQQHFPLQPLGLTPKLVPWDQESLLTGPVTKPPIGEDQNPPCTCDSSRRGSLGDPTEDDVIPHFHRLDIMSKSVGKTTAEAKTLYLSGFTYAIMQPPLSACLFARGSSTTDFLLLPPPPLERRRGTDFAQFPKALLLPFPAPQPPLSPNLSIINQSRPS